MSSSQTSDKPVLHLLDIDVSEINNYPSALQNMFNNVFLSSQIEDL